jgi:hypothetical protein
MTKSQQLLMSAVMDGDIGRVSELLANGADVEGVDQGGRTALHNATIDGKLDVARLLIERGADVNATDARDWTPLHFAAQDYRVDIAKLLLHAGATIDLQDSYGNTPLSNAVYYSEGRGAMIRLLLAHGANPHSKNSHGVSPFSLAETIADFDARQFFEHPAGVENGDGQRKRQRKMPAAELYESPRRQSETSEPLLLEFPGEGGFKTAFDAIRAAMEKLDAVDMGDRWISFTGQGKGRREDTYEIGTVPYSNRTFDLGHEKVDLPAILKSASLDQTKVKTARRGKITLADSTPEERARFLGAIFRKHFKLRPFEDLGDYMLGVEW